MSSRALLAAALLLVAPAAATTLQRVEVNASCLDGSRYSFYISVGAESSKFFIYHQGGSWCFSMQECAQRANSSLGSSVGWPLQQSMSDGMDRNPANNPLMHNWTFVYMPYADGGSFTGDAEGAFQGAPLYFHGLKIRQQTVAALTASFGFDAATDLVVGGGSAGGIAAYLHADFYAAQCAASSCKAIVMPDSGFFEDGDNDRDGKGDYDTNIQNLYGFMNSAAGISSSACTNALGYKCMFAEHLIPYIKVPIFALNSAYDATMGNGQCGADSGITMDWSNATAVNLCGNFVRGQLKALLAPPKNAVFLDACHHHCGEWNQITIDGLTCSKALQLFYTGGSAALPNSGYMDQGNVYPCDACCSP
jgi:hypothetical protein